MRKWKTFSFARAVIFPFLQEIARAGHDLNHLAQLRRIASHTAGWAG
jgi:hypothetical protein